MKYEVDRADLVVLGRAPQGARGLKLLWFVFYWLLLSCRAPQGARGLK